MKHITFKINLVEIWHEIWNSNTSDQEFDTTDSVQICLNFVKTQNCTVSSGLWPLICLIYLREIPRESRNSNNNRIRYKLIFLNIVKTQHCPVSSRLVLNDHLDEGQGAITMENLTKWSLLLLVIFFSFVIKSWLLSTCYNTSNFT